MTTELQDLARQLAGHPRWKGLPGTRDESLTRLLGVDETPARVDGMGWTAPACATAPRPKHLAPDLTDRGTIGVLQGMVEAWCEARGMLWSWNKQEYGTIRLCLVTDVEAWEIALEDGPDLATVAARALLWCMAQDDKGGE